MKLDRTLKIDGTEYPLVDADVSLALSEIGRASFIVQSREEPPHGIVTFDCGYADGRFYRYFLGKITHAVRRDAKSWTLQAREVCMALELPCPVSLRNCYIMDVQREITRVTTLNFRMLHSDYASTEVPRFANSDTGDALHALNSIARVFRVPDFVWFQDLDGKIWLGNWAHSFFAERGNIEIPDKLFTRQQAANMATLPAIPSLRPGALVNGKRLQGVRLMGHEVHLSWTG